MIRLGVYRCGNGREGSDDGTAGQKYTEGGFVHKVLRK